MDRFISARKETWRIPVAFFRFEELARLES
jgi:hypothetical protein